MIWKINKNKVMKAPERLWIDIHQDLSDSFLYAFAKNDNDSDIEYVQKDAFIEKAWNWIEDNILSSNLQDKSLLYYEWFKNYMKGE